MDGRMDGKVVGRVVGGRWEGSGKMNGRVGWRVDWRVVGDWGGGWGGGGGEGRGGGGGCRGAPLELQRGSQGPACIASEKSGLFSSCEGPIRIPLESLPGNSQIVAKVLDFQLQSFQ